MWEGLALPLATQAASQWVTLRALSSLLGGPGPGTWPPPAPFRGACHAMSPGAAPRGPPARLQIKAPAPQATACAL